MITDNYVVGIGPTHDDVTYEGVAAAFGDELMLSQEILKFWSYFTGDMKGNLTSSRKFSTIPKSSVILYPEVPHNVVSKGNFPVVTVKNVLICPGVPKFLAAIFSALEGSYFNSNGVVFYNKAIYLHATEGVSRFHIYKQKNNNYLRYIFLSQACSELL